TTQIRGTAGNGVFGEATVSVTAPPAPVLNLATSQNISGVSRTPTLALQVPADHKVIGCGARLSFDVDEPGLYFTALYPSDARTCTATARDHIAFTDGTVEVWAIAVIDPRNEWEVVMVNQPQTGNTATAVLPPGYALTGGGARVTFSGAGVMLSASQPSGSAWVVRSRSHIQADTTATTTSYVIGIRPRNGAAAPATIVTFAQSNASEVEVFPVSGYTIVGGGASIAWNGPGRLLTAMYPDQAARWLAQGKEHLQPDQGAITAYVIGIRQ
ncbi:MAG: hypothetical protein ACRENP_18210, partial [Longimicrobiales bacterium]